MRFYSPIYRNLCLFLHEFIIMSSTHQSDLKLITEGLTYDDVLLLPAYSEVLPRDVQLKSKFSRNIDVNTPMPPC